MLLAVLCCARVIVAQQAAVRTAEAVSTAASAIHAVYAVGNGEAVPAPVGDETETVRYLVHVGPSSQRLSQSLYKTGQADAAARRSEVSRRIDGMPAAVRTLREFSILINGFCVQTQRKNVSELIQLPGVTGVTEDMKVKAFAAAAPVAAPSASPLLGVATGKGIKVGVIDTGIDYMHEALGGGLGPAYKVCGGYDFVNNDADPMDDDGHGTHVAGIIAGRSAELSGMAADASLYAYKVLNANGDGFAGDVIAAVERAIQDGVTVINLSLGAPNGDPDDDLSQAVDYAAAMGIVVVAAAGNDGGSGTIGTPGAARRALTVGAVDAKNMIASFSSKGPTQKNFGLKPDVVAPGVNISSAKPGGGYAIMSGTSMSTPYVAGLAAVLAELYPSWSADRIRCAIIESARRLPSYPLFAAGSGCVDPLKAVRMQTIAFPASMSLGFNTANAAAWTRRETVYVANTSSTPATYSFSSVCSSPGVTTVFTPPSVTVQPFQGAAVVAEIRAANAELADNMTLNDGYAGSIILRSARDTVTIPFAFFKGTMLQLNFSETPLNVIVHNRKTSVYAGAPKSGNLCLVVPAGTYDIISKFYPSHYVVRESVQTAGLVQLTLRKDEARHPLRLIPIDEAGTRLETDQPHEVFTSIGGLVHCASGIGMVSTDYGAYTAKQSEKAEYISDISPRYLYGSVLNILKGNSATYTYEAVLTGGIADSATIAFAPAEGKSLEVRYDVDSSKYRTIFPILFSFVNLQGMVGIKYYDGESAPLRYPFTQRSVYFTRSSPFFPVFHQREAYKY